MCPRAWTIRSILQGLFLADAQVGVGHPRQEVGEGRHVARPLGLHGLQLAGDPAHRFHLARRRHSRFAFPNSLLRIDMSRIVSNPGGQSKIYSLN